MFPQTTIKDDVIALLSGLALLSVGTVALIGAGGFVLWMAGVQ